MDVLTKFLHIVLGNIVCIYFIKNRNINIQKKIYILEIMTCVPTKKSLFTSHIDVAGASREFSNRYHLQSMPGYCLNSAENNKDSYGRLVGPYTLQVSSNGSCNHSSPHHNVNAWLARENAERGFISVPYPSNPYDTMNTGRHMMDPRGGLDGSGGWHRMQMPKASDIPATCLPPEHHHHKEPSSGLVGRNACPMHVDRY